MKIVRATHQHIELVASLFDQYRVFYQCHSDLALARHFIAERIEHHESVIFLAMEGEQAVGFT
ncbi:hypothetical protein NFHSH190041_08140 [Shewanella sp. NFH-SH190041]|uniref:hypothetical protein n=1 Tax=Shewanella sp. NFH-SH190041 TaxID=2950245 RepID=UPI0021C3CACE|nr:hypothetical protein [Shewanella sp. NFH-SH190041]BDM63362.1 hypothetical protein NFHSH190041_08140 [Shewanella sp. NFH-SH190041]